MLISINVIAHHGSSASVGLGIGNSQGLLTLKKRQFSFSTSQLLWYLKPITRKQMLNDLSFNSNCFDIHKLISSEINMAYGLSNNISLSIQAAFLSLSFNEYTNYGGQLFFEEQMLNSLSDIRLNVMWNIYNSNSNNLKLAMITGVEVSVSKTAINTTNYANLSSGSIDPILGFASSLIYKNAIIKTVHYYKYTNQNKLGIKQSNVLFDQINLSYTLLKSKKNEQNNSLQYLFNISSEYFTKEYIESNVIEHTGNYRLFLGTGLALSIKNKYTINVTVEKSIIERMNGLQNQSSLRASCQFNYLFNL